MPGAGPGRTPLRVDRLDPHRPHQPLSALAIDAQYFGHLAAAVKRRSQILLVDRAHQRQVLLRLAGRPVIPRAVRKPYQRALPYDRELLVVRFDASPQSFK